MVEADQLRVRTLGECRIESPLGPLVARQGTTQHYVDENDRVLLDDTVSLLRARGGVPVDRLPSFEAGGPMRGALTIAEVVRARDRRIAVVGVPKTIDNDIPFIEQSFGFQTAFAKAADAIRAAHVEATAQPGGIGLVQLMGRHCGFIA